MSNRSKYLDLKEFFREYDAPMIPGRYTCVGLSAVLASKLSSLEMKYPGLKDAMYQVSCEEEVKRLEKYHSKIPSAKSYLIEHVLLCIRLQISGRPGVMLFDPGYHVSQPITVMEDTMPPHTANINGSTTRPDITRTYNYHHLSENSSVIAWDVEEKRKGITTSFKTSIIQHKKPFLSSVDLVERRNLVYTFKTLLGRNSEGHLTCGLYFPVRECSKTSITFFYQVDGLLHHKKFSLSYFLSGGPRNEEIETAVVAVATGTGRTVKNFRPNLVTLAHILSDQVFVQEILKLDQEIENITVTGDYENP